jgi:hypothetical protein
MSSQLRVNTITSTTGVGTVTLGSGGVSFSGTPTFNDVTLSSINGNAISGTRNRVINSAMEIDQRNAGASVSLNNSGLYPVDRWIAVAQGGSGTGTATAQRVADAPAGFLYSLKYTVTNSKAPTAGDGFYIYQPIEGQNIIDFAFGTASAKTVTLSFWVKSSLIGTFCGFLRSQTAVPVYRSYVFNYTINSANTWEYKTITVTGDAGMVPSLDNTTGIGVLFDLGSGNTYQTSTLNTWQTGNFYRSTSSTNLISTNGATWQVTGVQLEAGTVATPFERRSIGQEIALCQRYYYQVIVTLGSGVGGSWSYPMRQRNFGAGTGELNGGSVHPVTMRTSPTMTYSYDINDAAQTTTGLTIGTYPSHWQYAITVSAGASLDMDAIYMTAEL